VFNIKYEYRDLYGCFGSANKSVKVIDCNTVDVDDKSFENQVRLYPNPCHEKLSVVLRGTGLCQVQILNTQGQKVWDNSSVSAQALKEGVDVSALSSGIYLLQLNQEGKERLQTTFMKE